MHWRTRGILSLFSGLILLAQLTLGQTTSGVIGGNVVDPQAAAVAGAAVTLTNSATGVVQQTKSASDGEFVFPSVIPGTYRISVEASGFQKLEKQGLVLTAAQRLSAGTIQMQVGAVTSTVTVGADATPVETTSSERSAVVDSKQLQSLLALGRDYTSLMRILPGSTYEGSGNSSLGPASVGNINGVRNSYMSINVDGAIANTRNVGITENPLNMDAISEVKVLTSNYQAEYGKVSGAVIDVVTKSGTQDFHGTAYYYLRNEAFNANTFFNNLNGEPRSRYRYNTVGYNIGGPIYGPGPLRGLKNKLFFFYSGEDQPNKSPAGLRTFTMPTAAERQGDFSKSVNSSGQLYVVTNPLTHQPYANNQVPVSQINPTMQKLLSIFPQPNFFNTGVSHGNYNYVISDDVNNPVHQQLLRVDFDPTEKWRIYFRGMNLQNDGSSRTEPGIDASWLDGTYSYNQHDPNLALNVTYAPTANIVNELALGAGFYFEQNAAPQTTVNQFVKSAQGIAIGQLYPQNNPEDFLPALSFGNIPNAAGVSYDPRWPMDNSVVALSLTDGLSVVHRNHTMKFGIYTDASQYEQPHHAGNGDFSGGFTFTGANPNNPFNTGYAYAEALLGYFDSYSESSARPNYWGLGKTFEWYGQDSWRVSKKLTLEYGLRFTYDIPQRLKNNQGAMFYFNQYNAAEAPPLFQPVSVNGTRMMQNPVNGQLYPAVYYNNFVPGVGNTAPGSVLASSPQFPGLFESQGVLIAPRLGFAYDVFGDGKTAIRGGFGMFNNQRIYQGAVANATFNPPTISYPTAYYGNVNSFLSTPGVQTPSSLATVMERNSQLPQNYNLTLSIQREIGFQTVLDIAYVGVLGRHLTDTRQLNEVPYGAQFLPQNQDPTTQTPLADNYFRPYPGYAGIPYTEWADSSNYHSLQVQVNHRFSHGLQFGGAYTWSKSLGYSSGSFGSNMSDLLPTYLSPSLVYGPSGQDRRNRLVINWLWDIPNAGRAWNNWASRWILDNWEVSGIATFSSGAPNNVTFSTTDGQNVTGGGDGAAITVTGNPVLSRNERGFNAYFNPTPFARTPVGSIGNAWTPLFYGPGTNDWDVALFKNIPIEKFSLQFRCETYNTFNHTQYSSVDTNAMFDPGGNQVNTDFAHVNDARSPRILQLAVRVTF